MLQSIGTATVDMIGPKQLQAQPPTCPVDIGAMCAEDVLLVVAMGSAMPLTLTAGLPGFILGGIAFAGLVKAAKTCVLNARMLAAQCPPNMRMPSYFNDIPDSWFEEQIDYAENLCLGEFGAPECYEIRQEYESAP